MDILSVIEHKKKKQALTEEEIHLFVQGAAEGTIPDYQLAALLMAIRLNGMDMQETALLTDHMARSGHMLCPDVGGIPLDKHSTGGVGDTTTLVLAPLVAACGGKVLKMSGRGLGHTGGTVDKLESIPGMQVELDEETFVHIVREIGCCVVGQSKNLAPADKRLYALRDVTCTVDSIPLISSSILSKKFASGAKAIVLDVKVGSGALMPTYPDALSLAKTMVEIGKILSRPVSCVISGMEEPLGSHVGNALEVKEAIDILQGKAQGPLKDVALFLGSRMLLAAGLCDTEDDAMAKLQEAIDTGSGLQKFKEMIAAQGGNPHVCDDTGLLPQAPVIRPVYAKEAGFLCATDGVALGMAAQKMGAGRMTKDDIIDPAVGFVMKKRIGDRVEVRDVLCILHARDEISANEAEQNIRAALTFSPAPVSPARLIRALVDEKGVQDLP
ncbi:MAG: thymidine phosphorylase [Clostridia bacterium]|nr:thymidine phosphorylase [Clostridia bacterium]